MAKNSPHRKIFLSHAQNDAEVASSLKVWLKSVFDNVNIFASSDAHSMEMGADWYNTIDRELRECTIGILLLTETSIKRPWINYELGALRLAKKNTIPLCLGRVKKATLPSPFNHSHACDYENRDDRLNLLISIAKTFDFPTTRDWEVASDNAPSLLPGQEVQLPPLTIGHGLPIEQLFKTDDRWTTVVYTCRATFTGEECISGGPISKALWMHVPVDEVQTVCVAINHLMPASLRAHEDDILHTVLCSKSAEQNLQREFTEANGDQIPRLINRDLIIIGENNLSNLLLQMMQAYLPWQAGTGQVSRQRQAPRPDVYIDLVPQFNSLVPPDQKRDVHSGGAMIAIFPNPFNIRKRILVLFGCHREGQITLENWLRSDECREIVECIEKVETKNTQAIQIIVDKTLGLPTWINQPPATEALRNLSDGQRFWCTPLSQHAIGNRAVVNKSCMESENIYDVSLVVPLPIEEQAQFLQLVTERIGKFELYWEHEKCDIGFHITLYEFLTHYRPDPPLQMQLDNLTPRLYEELRNIQHSHMSMKVIARIRGIEFLPTAVVSYVDFFDQSDRYTNWLDSVRRWCDASVAPMMHMPGDSRNLLNVMQVPFPVHVTLCRFDRDITESRQVNLRRIANELRSLELLRFPIDAASLMVARKSPYRDVKSAGQLQL